MNRQKIGQTLFWLGVFSFLIWQILTWFQLPMQRIHTAEELAGTVYGVDGILWWLRTAGVPLGLTSSIIGALLISGEKGSYFWVLGFLPLVALSVGVSWTSYLPILFGVGGGVILLSYLGILWVWTQTYTAYEGLARTGKQFQLIGYSFLFTAGLFLCMYFGNPNVPALAAFPISSGQSINVTLALGMAMLFVGHYLVARSAKEATARPQRERGTRLRTSG